MICTFKYSFISLKESEKGKTFFLDQSEGNTFFIWNKVQAALAKSYDFHPIWGSKCCNFLLFQNRYV